MAELLRTERLRKTFRAGGQDRAEAFVAVDDASFRLDAGETLAIVGESGAGKSTVARLVLRLVAADSGRVWFDGEDVLAMAPKRLRQWRRRAQMIFQDPFNSLNPRMTIADAVAEPLLVYGNRDRADRHRRAMELLDRVGIPASAASRFSYEFSGGQLQRIAIARALTTEPDLLVCDEPVAALDVSVRAQVLNLLADLQKERGLALLFISHDLAIVQALAHRVAVMYRGAIVETGEARAVLRQPLHPYSSALVEAIPVPHPRLQRDRVTTTFEVDRPVPVPGCRFAPRCPHAVEACWTTDPPPVTAGGTLAACHRVSENARRWP